MINKVEKKHTIKNLNGSFGNMYKIKDLPNNEKKSFFGKLKYYVYIYCSIEDDNFRKPIYIGHGKDQRCLDHIKDLQHKNDQKSVTIKKLYDQKKLDIDIIAHKLNRETALAVESACIDLVGLENLENLVKGHGENIKRIPIEELSNKYNEIHADIIDEHKGFIILVNQFYKPNFTPLETLEIVRGIWIKKLISIAKNSKNPKYAFAAYNGIIKEVYEVFDWVPAGTQQYFTREFNSDQLKDKYEFVGKISNDLSNLYTGKLIPKGMRSYGDAFLKI